MLEAIKHKPVGYFPLDDTSPFQDYSGYGRVGTATGTVTNAMPLSSGVTRSSVFNQSAIGSFASPVFQQGDESSAFSLEAWISPIEKGGTDGEQQILGHSSAYDGLTINGTVISFVTKYLGGECRVEYDLGLRRAVHLIGVHLPDKNVLYVDGVLVEEATIADAQLTDSYVATDGSLYTGETLTTNYLAVNGIGIYAQALSSDATKAIYAAGRNQISASAVATVYSGIRIPLSRNEADVFLEQTWDKDSWGNGYRTDIDINNGLLVPKLLDGTSIPGNWLSSFNLEFADTTSIYGVSLTWEGEDAVVQTSLDGTSWETAVRGQRLALIPNDFNPTGQILEVRVSFPGGIIDDQSWISSLTVTGFKSGSFTNTERLITLPSAASIRDDHEPVQQREDWGVRLNGGTLTIGADQSADAHTPRTIELWVKRNTGSLTTNLTGTAYRSGTSMSLDAATPVGEWSLVHFITDTPQTTVITITGDLDIGQVVLYENVLDITAMQEIALAYTGYPIFRSGANSTVAIQKPALATDIYAYDWAIQASG